MNFMEMNLSKELFFENIVESKLKKGMIVKNYKILCGILEQPIKSGKSRKLQLANFRRYFDWEKSGQKFIITHIYDIPLTKEDKRKLGNNSIYVKYIEVILLEYLSKKRGYTGTLIKRDWWKELGMINDKYKQKSALEGLGYSEKSWDVKHFYQRCDDKLEQVFCSALKNLERRKLITYEIQTIIVQHDEKGRKVFLEATGRQKKQLWEEEQSVLKEQYEGERKKQVFLKNKKEEFYKKVSEKIKERYGWERYFIQIKISYTSEGIGEVYPELESKSQQERKELLNDKICEAVNKNARNKFHKWKSSRDKWEKESQLKFLKRDDSLRTEKPFCPPDTYLETQSFLKDELIKIRHKEMKFEIDKELDTLFEFER